MVDWLLNREHVEWAWRTSALATPVLALIVLVIFWPMRKRLVRNPFFWTAAASGPMLLILWEIYNAIEDAFGLDSIFGLVINLALFCLLGVIIGALLLMLHRRRFKSRKDQNRPRSK